MFTAWPCRSIGDADLKPALTAQPEVTHCQLTAEDEFVVLASDGLWDKLSNEEAVGLVYDTVKQPTMAAQRCWAVTGACMCVHLYVQADIGSDDSHTPSPVEATPHIDRKVASCLHTPNYCQPHMLEPKEYSFKVLLLCLQTNRTSSKFH